MCPLDGGVSGDGSFSTKLVTGSLKHAIGNPPSEDFRAVADSEWGKWFDSSKPCPFECKGTDGSK